MSRKPFKGIDHGTDKIRIYPPPNNFQGYLMKPIEIHLKRDGALDGAESFAILMQGRSFYCIGEITLKMLNEGLVDIGYEIVKK